MNVSWEVRPPWQTGLVLKYAANILADDAAHSAATALLLESIHIGLGIETIELLGCPEEFVGLAHAAIGLEGGDELHDLAWGFQHDTTPTRCGLTQEFDERLSESTSLWDSFLLDKELRSLIHP